MADLLLTRFVRLPPASTRARFPRSGSGPRDVAKSPAGPHERRWKGSEGKKVEGSGSKVRAVKPVASETIGA